MNPNQVGLLVVLLLCFVASGFFSGSETAVVAIPRERMPALAQSGARGARLAALVADPERTIGTILVANNFVNILATAIATVLAVELINESVGPIVATFGMTAIVLVAGEITPKTLASRYPERYGMAVAPILHFVTRALEPVAVVFRSMSGLVLRVLGIDSPAERSVTEADVRALALLGEEGGSIEQVEREIIESLFASADRPIRDIMTPRVDIVSIEEPVTMARVRDAISMTGHSRYPVVSEGGGLDDLVGVLSAKDLLRVNTDAHPERIGRMIRQPHYVPESAPVLRVLGEIRDKRLGFAMVLDEHGGIEGIITVKDLVAELVGDIQDEFDPGIPAAAPIGDGVWLASGSIPVEELAETTSVELPAGPYTTVGGLFLFEHGDIPEEGAVVELEGALLTVMSMDRLRISQLRVESVEQATE